MRSRIGQETEYQSGNRSGCGGCLNTAIVTFIFLIIGGALVLWGLNILGDARASASWPIAEGKVVSSQVEHSTDSEGGDSYQPKVNYTYSVAGVPYSGRQIKFGENSYSSRRQAEEIANRYPVGDSVAVYYEPENPEKTALEPGVTAGSYIVFGIGAIFVLVSLVLMPVGLLQAIRSRNRNGNDR